MSERVRKKSEPKGKRNRDKELDFDLMTVTSFGMPNRRGDAAEKHSLRLQIIAPKDDVYGTSSNPTRINTTNLNVPPRVRLPPRSRTGCWLVLPRLQILLFTAFPPHVIHIICPLSSVRHNMP